jgi:hypothetical protein
MALSFTIAAGPCQCSHFQVQVPWDLWPYFTVSVSRLPFLLPPMTGRATVEVFDPASTQDLLLAYLVWLYSLGMNHIENTASNNVPNCCSAYAEIIRYKETLRQRIS